MSAAAGAPVRTVVTGATGRTGNAVVHGLVDEPMVELVALVAPSAAAGQPTRPLPEGLPVAATLADVDEPFDVLVDFTTPTVAPDNITLACERRAHVVLGTTGIEGAQLEALGDRFAAAGLGLLYAPNFAIGAVLMMKYAADAARHIADVEIVEAHHAAKIDAPSGTARRTAELIGVARTDAARDCAAGASQVPVEVVADEPAARGERIAGVSVHSLRLAGAVAHQEVVLSGPGELLTIRHDAIDRGCYSSGVAVAVRRVTSLVGLTIGLEHVL